MNFRESKNTIKKVEKQSKEWEKQMQTVYTMRD